MRVRANERSMRGKGKERSLLFLTPFLGHGLPRQTPTAASHEQTVFYKRTASALSTHRRWAKEDHQEPDYDLEALRELVRAALDAGRCPYCGDALTVHNFSLDHDRPRSRGGRHSLPNLVCCCRRCNEVKGQLTGQEFRALIRLLRAWEPTGANSVLSRLRAAGKRMSA